MGSKAWTRNYDNFFSLIYGTFGSTGTTSSPTYDKPWFKDVGGIYRGLLTDYAAGSWNAMNHYIGEVTKYGATPDGSTIIISAGDRPDVSIQLGTGTGTATKDDYRLFLPLTSNCVLGTCTRSWGFDNETHTYTKTIKIPIAYSGSTPVTITEFGIFGMYIDIWSGSYPAAHQYMIYHEFLDTPVTLEQNDTIEITFSQSIVQPNYTPYPTTE